jgi:hypothetical protein
VEAIAEGDRVVTHFFESAEPGYRGWRWAVTVTRASRAKIVTLAETVLLPGADALLAPEWVPWSERLRPGDMGPGDLLPTEAEDLRLEPGYTGEDVPPPNSVVSEEMEQLAAVEEADVTAGPPSAQTAAPRTGTIASLAEELGMRRARVLSRYGLHVAADRWDEAYGAKAPMAQAAPGTCVTCGFLMPLAGSLRQAFGVCANEFQPGGRPGGLPGVRLRSPLRGGRHAQAPAPVPAGGRRDHRRADAAAPGPHRRLRGTGRSGGGAGPLLSLPASRVPVVPAPRVPVSPSSRRPGTSRARQPVVPSSRRPVVPSERAGRVLAPDRGTFAV